MEALCSDCGQLRPIKSRGRCVSCASKDWKRRNPELVKAARRDRYIADKADRESSWAAWARRAAKGRGVPVTVLAAMQDATTHCPVCGVQLIYAADDNTNAHASLDRIVPGVDYRIIGNLAITCIACNRVRRDADLTRLRQLIAWLERVEPAARDAVKAAMPEALPSASPANGGNDRDRTREAFDHLRWVESLG